MTKVYFLSLILLLTGIAGLYGQNDSLIFKNGNFIVGEVKQMDRNVLTIETDYSDSDFTIQWKEVAEIHSTTSFLMTLTDGRRFNGTLSSASAEEIILNTEEHGEVVVRLEELVFLQSVEDNFASRLKASLDFGFSYTKSQNFRQFTASANVGYTANRWLTNLSYSAVNSSQDNVLPTQRNQGAITFRYFLPRDWYALAQIDLLSSTEQLLDLRANGQLGIGKYLVHTNSIYWGAQAGLAFNNENYSTNDSDRQSLEGFFGTEYNMYDVGDINIFTNLAIYPSFTEQGRWRIDYKIDLKYDLPLDFYIKTGFSLNYDNQPVEGASGTDYIFTTSFGWEW